MIIVVMGMHKSGTTLVSRLLHGSGISMGDFDETLGYRDGNKFERREAQEANRDLLHGLQVPPLDYLVRRPFRAPTDAAGYRINRDSQSYIRHRALARRLARPDASERVRPVIDACLARHEDWGFKDPRTCLTYPAWRRALPEHRVVAVYRGLDQVLERAARGKTLRAMRVIHAWSIYNGSILRNLEEHPAPSLVLRFEELMQGDAGIERLARFVGRPLKDAREPALYRTRQAPPLPAWSNAFGRLLPMAPREIATRLAALAGGSDG